VRGQLHYGSGQIIQKRERDVKTRGHLNTNSKIVVGFPLHEKEDVQAKSLLTVRKGKTEGVMVGRSPLCLPLSKKGKWKMAVSHTALKRGGCRKGPC